MARNLTPRGPRGPYRAEYFNLQPVEKARLDRRMTQAQAAEAFGVTERTWRSWERGAQSAPSAEYIGLKLDHWKAQRRYLVFSGLAPADSNRKAPAP